MTDIGLGQNGGQTLDEDWNSLSKFQYKAMFKTQQKLLN